MSNAALDILRARQIAISNDVAIKKEKMQELESELKSIRENVYTLQYALETIKNAVELLEKENIDEQSSQSRSTRKSKKTES
jgi:uncharacterized protein YlxW (UPF0749 family)